MAANQQATVEEHQLDIIPLEMPNYKYHDGLTDHYINDMRVRAHQRAKHAA